MSNTFVAMVGGRPRQAGINVALERIHEGASAIGVVQSGSGEDPTGAGSTMTEYSYKRYVLCHMKISSP